MQTAKRIIGSLVVLVVLGFAVVPAAAQGATETIELPVEGMVCPFCAAAVENILADLDGIVLAQADPTQGKVTITYLPEQVSPEQMVDAINNQTFYRAYLPGADTTPRTGPFGTGFPALALIGGLMLAAVIVLWRFRDRLPRVWFSDN